MINQEEIDLYSLPIMQEYFNKVMGPWQAGDVVYETKYQRLGIVMEVRSTWTLEDDRLGFMGG
jgi:hypothetical protein